MKPVLFIKQIHSSLSAWSSNDSMLYFFVVSKEDLDFKLEIGETVRSEKFPMLNFDEIQSIDENVICATVYMQDDKTFYNTNLGFCDHATKEDMDKLTFDYVKKGWTTEKPGAFTILYEVQEKARIEARKWGGYVIPAWSKDLKVEEYQGGLTNDLFNDDYLQKYLVGGGCHGYIGAPERTFAIDRELESYLKNKNWTIGMMAIFMCSRNGRHFADQLNSSEDVEKYFNDYDPSEETWFKQDVKK